MRAIATIACVFLAGCAGADRATEERIETAKQCLANDPEAALRELEPVFEDHPSHIRARRLRAVALERAGRPEEAIEAWAFVIHARGKQSDRMRLEAHNQFARLVLERLGELPDCVTTPPEGEERELIVAAQTSLTTILESDPHHRFALLGKANTQYRLGLAERALPLVDQRLTDAPDDEEASFLRGLLLEQMAPSDPQARATFFQLSQSRTPAIRAAVASHLLHLWNEGDMAQEPRDNIRGVLLRMLRDGEFVPEVLRAWEETLGRQEQEQLESRRLAVELAEVEGLVAAGDFHQAWWILAGLPAEHAVVVAKRREVAEAWARGLLESGGRQLAARRLDEARATREAMAAIPPEAIPPTLAREMQRFRDELIAVDRTLQLKLGLGRAEDAMRRRQPQEALSHLEGLELIASGEQRDQLFLIRAHALLAWGDRKGALLAFDEVSRLKEISDKREYALLLVEAGRAEEATEFLDLLPLGAMRGEVLDALIASLEKQGKWESILSRLADLSPLPKRLVPVRRKACVEACDRWLRIGNPERAMRVLKSYAEAADLEQPPLIGIYLQAAIRTGDTAASKRLLLESDASTFAALPEDIVLEGLERLGGSLGDAERYGLLQRLERGGGDEVEARLAQLAPRFGRYLPVPGSYRVNYRITTPLTEGDGEETRTIALAWTWDGDRFQVEGDGFPAETWWIEDSVWHRETPDGEILIPVRVQGGGPMPRTTFPLRGLDAGAEIVEAGTRVAVGDEVFDGCLRVRLNTGGANGEQIFLDLAPSRGEIRREVVRGGARVELWEMTLFTSGP